jgi:hypothetical protein
MNIFARQKIEVHYKLWNTHRKFLCKTGCGTTKNWLTIAEILKKNLGKFFDGFP